MEFIQKILYVGALFRLIGFSYITYYQLPSVPFVHQRTYHTDSLLQLSQNI